MFAIVLSTLMTALSPLQIEHITQCQLLGGHTYVQESDVCIVVDEGIETANIYELQGENISKAYNTLETE